MSALKLKICPFCKCKKVSVLPYDEIFEFMGEQRQGGFSTICDAQKGGCGASSGWASTRKEAAELWNRR